MGAVERDAILDGSDIRPGDAIIGIPSNGLHTNGYSLVRHALALDDNPSALNEVIPELGAGVTLGDALLTPHPSYVEAVRPVLPMLKGMAHITGGGIIENIPRILPDGTSARFDSTAWRIPPIFTLLQERAAISRQEMYRVFNMGIGMALVCDAAEVNAVLDTIPSAELVGEVSQHNGGERVSIA